MKQFNSLYTSLPEKDEHKKSKEYKRLTPKMKSAVDDIFTVMDAKPSDFLNTFDKTIKIKSVLNSTEGISILSNCEKIIKYKLES